jgi:hypothetical protein
MCFHGRKRGVDEEFKRCYACYYNGCIFPFRISALKAASLADFSPTEGFACNIVLNVSRKLMFRKMALILANTLEREERSERSAWTATTPRADKANGAEEAGFRVRQRTFQLALRNSSATEEPWFPVAPIILFIFLEAAMT